MWPQLDSAGPGLVYISLCASSDQQKDRHSEDESGCCYLVEDFLQVGGSHAVGQVSVRWVRQEELPLSLQRRSDVFLPVDVLLTAIHHPDVT